VNTTENAKWHTQIIKGVSYVYEDYPYWNKDKKQNPHKREYIGKTASLSRTKNISPAKTML